MGVPGIVETGAGEFNTAKNGTSAPTGNGAGFVSTVSVADSVPNTSSDAARQYDAATSANSFLDNFGSVLSGAGKAAAGGAALAQAFSDDGNDTPSDRAYLQTTAQGVPRNRAGGGGGTGRSYRPGVSNVSTDADQSGGTVGDRGGMFSDPGNVLVMGALVIAGLYFAGQLGS
jgi:hypothetical protein